MRHSHLISSGLTALGVHCHFRGGPCAPTSQRLSTPVEQFPRALIRQRCQPNSSRCDVTGDRRAHAAKRHLPWRQHVRHCTLHRGAGRRSLWTGNHLTTSRSTPAGRTSRVSREVLASGRQFRSTHSAHCLSVNPAALHSPSKIGIGTLGRSPFSSGGTACSITCSLPLAGTFSQTDAATFAPDPLHRLAELAVAG